MQMIKTPYLAMLTLAVLVSACGGGSTTESAPTRPNAPTEAVSSMVTTVAPPTYSLGSEELAAFNRLNAERLSCGFGSLKQDTRLDQAALAHADWMLRYNVYAHTANPALPIGFTGVNPWDRTSFAGYPATFSTRESIAFGSNASKIGRGDKGVRELFAGVYHAIDLLRPMKDVGVSVRAPADVGVSTMIVPTEIVLGTTDDYQMLASDAVVTYPCQGTTGTEYQLTDEEPNPVPGRNLGGSPLGQPIIVMARLGQRLTLTTASMQRVSDGQAVALRSPVTGAADPNGLLANDPHVGYVFPDAPLQPNTAYRVSISGTNNGTAFQRTFTFTTGS